MSKSNSHKKKRICVPRIEKIRLNEPGVVIITYDKDHAPKIDAFGGI